MTQPIQELDVPATIGGDVRLQLRNVTKAYGRTVAVDDVSLSVREGEFLTFLGQSGSGKTTVLKMVAGFESHDSGTIEIAGSDVAAKPPRDRNVAMVFQQYALFPHMSVSDNIGYGLKRRKWSRAKRKARIDEMLELVHLGGLGGRAPRQLSGGQQQRVAVARALAPEPQLLLMDEPLGALDRALRLDLEHELRRIHRSTGCTVVYVTHDRDEALALSDRIGVFHEGKLVGTDSPEGLYRRPPTGYVARLLTDANLVPLADDARLGGGMVTMSVEGREVSFPSDADTLDHVRIAVPRTAVGPAVSPSSPPADRASSVITATVADVVFLGEYVKLNIEHPELGELIVHTPGAPAAELVPGQTTEFTINVAKCLAVR